MLSIPRFITEATEANNDSFIAVFVLEGHPTVFFSFFSDVARLWKIIGAIESPVYFNGRHFASKLSQKTKETFFLILGQKNWLPLYEIHPKKNLA